MIIVLSIGFCVEFAMIIWLSKTVLRHNNEVFNIEFETQNLKRKVDGYKESVEVLSDSIRVLNGMVKDLDHKKEKSGIDTQALVSGWDADDPESEDPVKKHIVDIMLNGTYEQKQYLINTWTLQSALLGQAQQGMYPWSPLQSTLLSQTQQCIYPWQQTPSGAILPLWYINRRLEDM